MLCFSGTSVPRQYLPGAVALNSLTYNVARFIGPAISGPMITAWGGAVYRRQCVRVLLRQRDHDAAASGISAVRMGSRGGGSVLHDALEGLRYVTRHPGIGPLLLFAATVGMTLRAVGEMLPPYVSILFYGGAEGLAIPGKHHGCAGDGRGIAGGGPRTDARAGADRGGMRAVDGARDRRGSSRRRGSRLRWCASPAMGAGQDGARDFLPDADAELGGTGDGQAGAEPVGHDHAGRPGDGSADLWRGGRGPTTPRLPVLVGVVICTGDVWARTWLRLNRLASALEGVEAAAE